MKLDLSPKATMLVGVAAALAILLTITYLLFASGVIRSVDNLKGYYAIQVNPAPDAPPDKQGGNMVFGFERLSLNEDHTFRLGFLRGNWRRLGSSLTLTPVTIPAPEQFYAQTTMAEALSVLFKPTDFTVSGDGKTLTAVNPANDPLVFTKTGDGLR